MRWLSPRVSFENRGSDKCTGSAGGRQTSVMVPGRPVAGHMIFERTLTQCLVTAALIGACSDASAQAGTDRLRENAGWSLLAGLGRRETVFSGFTGHRYVNAISLVLTKSRPIGAAIAMEPEVGLWWEQRLRFMDGSGRHFAYTTHLANGGVNLILAPRSGRFRPRAGIGLGLYVQVDTGTNPAGAIVTGGNANCGAEVRLSDRVDIIAGVRGDLIGAWYTHRLQSGIRVRSR